MSRRPFAVRPLAVACVCLALFFAAFALAPSSKAQRSAGGARTREAAASSPPLRRSPEIARIVSEINAANIERTIRKLVSFGTRNTLSAQDNPTRGIGAARDYLYAELSKIAEASEGRMTVEKQTFEQAPGKFQRIARATTLTNVVATLRGTQPASENRVYVVSGHYDSM